jgi:hypothetical protein
MNHYPVWLQSMELKNWPTQLIESSELHYRVPICRRWNLTPEATNSSEMIEHHYTGYFTSDHMVINFMQLENTDFRLQDWVEYFLQLQNFPVPIFIKENQAFPELLEWEYQGEYSNLKERFEVNEIHLYQGLALLPIQPQELARFYILVARREQFAWKVMLSFLSACLPGSSPQEVNINDHQRAAATFGGLCFL